ncbi:peptidylprolyl isomerase [Gemmatimonas phototrophica]|nr:peptidylprolyl isomerase [Gemmatimonas phototrophica]
MWSLALQLLTVATVSHSQVQPPPTPYQVMVAEHARLTDAVTIERAIASGDSVLQRLAARALGRTDDEGWALMLDRLMDNPAASVRREAVRAAAQLQSAGMVLHARSFPFTKERDPSVRAELYETFGRGGFDSSRVETALLTGLTDESLDVQRGAARGMESYLRRRARTSKASPATLNAVAAAAVRTTDPELRLTLLLALNAAAYRDSAAIRVGLADADPEIRRVAVMLGRTWVDDRSPMVRWQALRAAGTCDRAVQHVRDRSEHVRLLAIDLLGTLRCDPAPLYALSRDAVHWRPRAHAVFALTYADSAKAGRAVRALAASPTWQARAWAARAARRLNDEALLRRLANDVNPNVRVDAITTREEAVQALQANHAGLLLQAATMLKKVGAGATRKELDAAVRSFERISRTKPLRWRDAREVLLPFIIEADQAHMSYGGAWLTQWVRDGDPVIQRIATEAVPAFRFRQPPGGTVFIPPLQAPPFPSEAQLRALDGAMAVVTVRGRGRMELQLLPDVAPAAVHAFATLAERGAYAGKTWHRIVPNFVVQGGSPGANEYDPATTYFMRDEVGARNVRGSFGISTRGRDTGDGQLYINIVNNMRLDHDYTVFATMSRGFDVMDTIQEGDVIESVVIRRSSTRSR